MQVQELDRRNPKPKVIVADSLYANHIFLAVFVRVKHVFVLVRLRSNMVFSGKPKPHPKGTRGAPAKHGPKFKLSAPSRPPDQSEYLAAGRTNGYPASLAWLTLQESARTGWNGAEGRVLALGWHAPLQTTDVAVLERSRRDSLQDLCRMYLWRFAIEIVFPQMTKTGVFAC